MLLNSSFLYNFGTRNLNASFNLLSFALNTSIHRCIKHLQKKTKPKGVELADDEYILHVEGTASSQRVVRHTGGTSWPGN